jgi:hypothetical protein
MQSVDPQRERSGRQDRSIADRWFVQYLVSRVRELSHVASKATETLTSHAASAAHQENFDE